MNHFFTMVWSISLRNLLVKPYWIKKSRVSSLFSTKTLLNPPLLGCKISWIGVLTISSGKRRVALRMLHYHSIPKDAFASFSLRASTDSTHIVDSLYCRQVGH